MSKKWINVDVDEDVHATLSRAAAADDLKLRQYVRRVLKRAASSIATRNKES